MELGEVVRDARKKRGLKQGELATLAGVSASFISRLEDGQYKVTSQESLQSLARALNMKVEQLTAAAFSKKPATQYIRPQGIGDMARDIQAIQTNFIEVPIVAELHMPGEILEYIYIPRIGPGKVNYVGVKAKGYCLAPDVMEGDTLIIDKDAAPEIGKTILCYHNGNEHPQLLKLKKPSQLKDCEVYGVVVGIFRRM